MNFFGLFCLLNTMACSCLLMLIAMAAMFGDPTLSHFQGISWAVDTADHRISVVFIMTVWGPMSGLLAGRYLWPKQNSVVILR